MELFEALPGEPAVQHQQQRHADHLLALLQRHPQLQVQSVQQPVPVTVLLPAADSGDANLAIAALVSTVIALICVAYY